MHVNHHQANIHQLQEEKKFLLDVTSGKAKISNIDFKVVVHTLGNKELESSTSRPISTVCDVLFPDNNLLSIEHPMYHAKVLRHTDLTTRCLRNPSIKDKFNDVANEHKPIFEWFQQFEYVQLKSIEDLRNLGTKLEILPKTFEVQDNFFHSYAKFKELFQKKFMVFFSILDGNHRATVLTKLLDREPFSDHYIKNENDKAIPLDNMNAKVFDIFTVDIEYHPTILIDSRSARKQSYQIRSAGSKFFGSKYLDYFSAFSKYINNTNSIFKECNDENFFGYKYGENVTDAFMDNVTNALSEMVFIVTEFTELNVKNEEVLKQMKKKNILEKFYKFSNRGRKRISFGSIVLPEETVLLLELMRLFCGKKSVLPQFTSFLSNSHQLPILKNNSECHFDRQKTYVIKNLVTTIHRISHFMFQAFVEELAKEHGKTTEAVSTFFMHKRLYTMIQISTLEEIIGVWKEIGYDPQVYIKSVLRYGSVDLTRKVFKLLDGQSNDPIPYLLLLLDEYENNHRAYLNYIKNTAKFRVFDFMWMQEMKQVFKSNRNAKSGNPEGKLKCKSLKLTDKIERIDNTSVLFPGSFKTFMSLFFPCLFTPDQTEYMEKFRLVFPKDNFLEEKHKKTNQRDNLNHRRWNFDDYVLRKFIALDMTEKDAPLKKLTKKISMHEMDTNTDEVGNAEGDVDEDIDLPEPMIKLRVRKSRQSKEKRSNQSSEKSNASISTTSTNRKRKIQDNSTLPEPEPVEHVEPGESRRIANRLLNSDIYSIIDTEGRAQLQRTNRLSTETETQPDLDNAANSVAKKSNVDSAKSSSSSSSSSVSSSSSTPSVSNSKSSSKSSTKHSSNASHQSSAKQTESNNKEDSQKMEVTESILNKNTNMKSICDMSDLTGSSGGKTTLILLGSKLQPFEIDIDKIKSIEENSTYTENFFKQLQEVDLGHQGNLLKEDMKIAQANIQHQKNFAVTCTEDISKEKNVGKNIVRLALDSMDDDELANISKMVEEKRKKKRKSN